MSCAMEIPLDWAGVIQSVHPWLPGSRMPCWNNSKVIAWRCDGFSCGTVRGTIVDVQLPSLGQTPCNRSIISTLERIEFICEDTPRIQVGRYYLSYGTLCPVWHGDVSCWRVQWPKPTARTGVCRILCDKDVGYNIHAAEICSGAMGGWNFALRNFPRWVSEWSIDFDEMACETFSKNHAAVIITEPEKVSIEQEQFHLLLKHDLRDLRWLHVTNVKDSDVWMISHPCQPWTSMAFGGGSSTADGQILLTILQSIRMCQPAYVMFENVPGFRRHHEFESFLQTLQSCGYARYSSLTMDMGTQTHMSRKRWLGVFINTLRIEDWKSLGLQMASPSPVNHTFLPSNHCLRTMTQQQLDRVKIQEDEYSTLDKANLLPPWLQESPQASTCAISLRTYRTGDKLPVMQASYRKAVEFGSKYLRKKGLMAWILVDNAGHHRWLQKFEAAYAFGFPRETVIPKCEHAAMRALGNSISPWHASTAIMSCMRAMQLQTGRSMDTDFGTLVMNINGARADLSQDTEEDCGAHHCCLMGPTSRTQDDGHLEPSENTHEAIGLVTPPQFIFCPHCNKKTDKPLVVACRVCYMIACDDCRTEVCDASHLKQHGDELQNKESEQEHGTRQFSISSAGSIGSISVPVALCPDVQGLHKRFGQFPWDAYFRDYKQLCYTSELQHGDSIFRVPFPDSSGHCPQCGFHGAHGWLRICPACQRVGCDHCIAQNCAVCAKIAPICDACHYGLAQEIQNTMYESHGLDQHDWCMDAQGFQWAFRCSWLHRLTWLNVLVYPDQHVKIVRDACHDTWRIKTLAACAGAHIPQDPVFLWGTAKVPDAELAGRFGILVVPRVLCQGDVVPLQLHDGASRRTVVVPSQGFQRDDMMFLDNSELQQGVTIEYPEGAISSSGWITPRPGHVLTKLWPWRMLKRRLAGERADVAHADHPQTPNFGPATPSQASATGVGAGHRQPGQRRPSMSAPVCIGLDGKQLVLPELLPGMSWLQWVRDALLPDRSLLWATVDGTVVQGDAPLPGGPFVLRLRLRTRGGAKKLHNPTDVQKLKQHLQAKGVPEQVLQQRVDEVLQHVMPEQLSNAYKSLEPWTTLKQIVGTKVRLVHLHEIKALKSSKQQPNSSLAEESKGEDPWLANDPWKQAMQVREEREPVSIQLWPQYFQYEDGSEPSVIAELTHGSQGICLMSAQKAETLASVGTAMSAYECAAIVVATHEPKVSPFTSLDVSFVAIHNGCDKVLLRGYLINYGERKVSVRRHAHVIDVAEQQACVISIEIVRDYTDDWSQVPSNPLRFAWQQIDFLQKNLLTTWTRKFWSNKKPARPGDAKTWHCFGKLLLDNMDVVLKQSGTGGVFLNPRDEQGGPSGDFRVVWADGCDLEKALTISKSQHEVYGLVRGKNGIGYRVRTADYVTSRSKLDPTWKREGVEIRSDHQTTLLHDPPTTRRRQTDGPAYPG